MRFLFLLIFLAGFSRLASAQGIAGPVDVCNFTCYTYGFDFGSGGNPGTTVQWFVTDPSGNPAFFNILSNGDEIEICFEIFGSYTISAIVGNESFQMTVFVGEFSEVNMLMIRENCPEVAESGTCFKVCTGDEVTFEMDGHTALFVQWGVSGTDHEILAENLSSITLKVGDTPGIYSVSMFGQLESDRQCIFEKSFCFEVFEIPDAGFTSSVAAVHDTITLCQGQNLHLTNTSSAHYTSWTITNGFSAETRDLVHKFEVAGIYVVRQFVSNACDCEDDKSVIIKVLDHPAPQIYCAATACLGDTLSYQTDADCEDYIWTISPNGTIIAGGTASDDFIEVSWVNGGQGIVELSHACSDVCAAPGMELIPLIGDENEISGPAKICLGSSNTYRIDALEGTVFSWSASPGGVIESGQGSHTVNVRYTFKGATPFIAVQYDNCHLGCSGRDTIWLEILENFETSGPQALCEAENGVWNSFSRSNPSLSAPGIWSVQDQTGTIIYEGTVASAQFMLPFILSPGSYKLVNSLEDSLFCNLEFSLNLQIHPLPANLLPILGRDTVCLGKKYIYTVDNPDPNLIYVWQFIDGPVDSTMRGEKISWTWNDLSSRQILLYSFDPLYNCHSDTVSLLIHLIENKAIEGNDVTCEFGRATFEVDIPPGETIVWTFSDSTLVNVLGYPSDNSIKLKWLKTGTVTVHASYCSFMQSTLVNITGEYNPPIPFPDTICENQSVLVNAPGTYKDYFWFSNGSFLSNSTSVSVGPGTYLFLGVDANGCKSRSSFTAEESPVPDVEIYTTDPLGICPGVDTALLISVSEFGGPYTYTWFHNGMALSDGSDTLKVSRTGVYYRMVTNIHTGCSKISNSVEFCEHCDPNTVCYFCPCTGAGVCDLSKPPLTIEVNPTAECDVFDLRVTNPTIINSTVRWIITDLIGRTTVVSGNPLQRRFLRAGRVHMTVIGSYVDTFGDTITPCPAVYIFVVPAVGRFTYESGCMHDNVVFNNRTEIDANYTAIGYNWDFGDPGSGANNNSALRDPVHLFSNSGTFQVNMRVDVSAGCYVEASANVFLRPLPDAGFVFKDSSCVDTELKFEPINLSALYYEWYFDRDNMPAVILDAVNPGLHGYEKAGIYNVGLRVTDVYGCVNESSDLLSIFGKPDPGTIIASAPLPACEEDIVSLSSTEDNLDYSWSNSESTKTIIAAEEGDYSLTLTNSFGCSSQTDPFTVEYTPSPDVRIAALSDAKVVFAPDTLQVCAGSNITLRALGPDPAHIISWSNGANLEQIQFDGIQNPRLGLGVHIFQATFTDPSTNCSGTSLPLYVRVIAAPLKPDIVVDKSPPYCSGIELNLSVQAVEAGITYTWQDGFVGSNLRTSLAGLYKVTASNDFGCSSTSPEIYIQGPPQLSLIPAGCFQTCDTADICIPTIPGAQITSWFQNGILMNPQPSNPGNPIFTESGSYHAMVRTSYGCEFETDALQYQVDSALGSLSGRLFLDLDADGMYSAGDSLIGNMLVIVTGQGQVDSTFSNTSGEFLFTNLPSGTYQITIDSLALLDKGLIVVQNIGLADIQYCDHRVEDLFVVLQKCTRDTTALSFDICKDETIDIAGTMWTFSKDSSFIVEILDSICPSYLSVEVHIKDEVSETLVLQELCEGDVWTIAGNSYMTDTIFTLDLLNVAGCDSIVRYDIRFAALPQEALSLNACPGDSVVYRGIQYVRDTTFTYTVAGSGNSCDSIFDVYINFHEPFTADIVSSPSCPNRHSGSVLIEALPGLEVWVNGSLYGIDYEVDLLSSGIQNIKLVDSNGCAQEFDVEIAQYDALNAHIPDVIIPCDSTGMMQINLTMSDTSDVEFEWFNGPHGAFLQVDKPGIYSATVKNQCEEITIHGRALRSSDSTAGQVFVPNAFTPNDDQINELFTTYWPENTNIESYLFEVFDRWGELQFRTTDPQHGWDGFGRNADEKVAVYVWKLDAIINQCDLRVVVKEYGDVTLIR